MTQRKIPTTLAVVIILIFLLGILYLSGTFLYARISAFAAAYPRYHARMSELIATVTSQLNLGFDPLAGINWGQSVGRFLMTLSGSVFAFASKLVLVVVFLFFILLGKPFFKYKILTSFSQEKANQLIQSAREQAEQHKSKAIRELNMVKSEVDKLRQEKSKLIDNIKETVRDHLQQFKK